MNSSNGKLNPAYVEHNTNIKVRNLRLGILLAFILFPLFIIADIYMYPNEKELLISIRVINNILISIILFISYKVIFSYQLVKYTNILIVLILNSSISMMIALTEGAMSPYYAGLNLVIIGASILFFFDIQETIISAIGTIGVYVMACLIHLLYVNNGTQYYTPELISNISFIIATNIICGFASYHLNKNRFESFKLNFELQELNKAKTDFFANISHEIRTPLTLVLSPLEELLKNAHELSEKVASRVTISRDGALRLLKLVNNLLDIVRLEDQATTITKTPQNISIILSGIANSMTHLASTKEILIINNITDDDIMITGHKESLHKIFMNIINNSLKFTPNGGKVTISLDEDGVDAIASIRDTGIGIEQDLTEEIFKRFKQVDGSSTRQFQGSGIGLSLVADLLRELDGSIEVESELGVGTLMRVRLPLLLTEDALDEDLEEPVAPHSLVESIIPEQDDAIEMLHKKALNTPDFTIEEEITNDYNLKFNVNLPRLLIVDDEPDMRRYIKEALNFDYQIIQAVNGAEALELAKQYTPDVMILDMMLPELNGVDVCKQLKQHHTDLDVKIILLTARVEESIKIEALQNGADDFLTKPFSIVELKTRLDLLYNTLTLERNLHANNTQLQQALTDLKEAEAQLLHSEKLSAIGSLSAGLLHEVNNPLNYTLLAAQLLKRDDTLDTDSQENVADIIEGMERIKTIVSDLRAFAYPEDADKQASFLLLSAIDSALRFTAYETKHMQITNTIEPIHVIGSVSHIVQVLINLITNAASALDTTKETHTLTLSSKIINDRVMVFVRDNGVGIESDKLSKIFEPFYTTREIGSGLGMGLSICHTIIQNHGGELSVVSKIGNWTEFSFDLALSN